MAGSASTHSSPWIQAPGSLASASTSPSTLPRRDPAASPFHDTNQFSHAVTERSSPNYFGMNVDHHSSNPPDSNPGPHAQKNWIPSSQSPSSLPSPSTQLVPQRTDIETIVNSLRFNTGNDADRQGAPTGQHSSSSADAVSYRRTPSSNEVTPSFFLKVHRSESLASPVGEANVAAGASSHRETVANWNSSLPSPIPQERALGPDRLFSDPAGNPVTHSAQPELSQVNPSTVSPVTDTATPVSAGDCADLLKHHGEATLILDVRPYLHYARSHIEGSLNLCVPTTLLKRPSFDTKKLEATFAHDAEKKQFSRWRDYRFIVVYDAATSDPRDAAQLHNVLRKFVTEGWAGRGTYLQGGLNAFSSQFPDLIQKSETPATGVRAKRPLSMSLALPSVAPVIGGCALPEASRVSNPFFNNIRQNMDLVGGVGQIPVNVPHRLTETKRKSLPSWLRTACDSQDQGRGVSEKFLRLEKIELERMRQALSYDSGGPTSTSDHKSTRYRVAGIEKGTKNRYNDIYCFDHSRVRLQNVPAGDCDYVNANYIKSKLSNRRYIATQAPVPDTFNDFWTMVWEQDVRVIVSLTAEVEQGRVKCHPYWKSGDYGPFRVKCFAQRSVPIESKPGRERLHLASPVSVNTPSAKTGMFDDVVKQHDDDPMVIVRHFSLCHSAFPFQPLREITQLQYPSWPDFGTTSQPGHLLKLIEQCNKVIRATSLTNFSNQDADPGGQRPVLVHCSAGCGRTGTFCTVDSVLDVLKRQRAEGKLRFVEQGGTDSSTNDDRLDLVAEAVQDFRTQRPSLVQNLSQFVLCYETVLEWFAQRMEEEDAGRSA